MHRLCTLLTTESAAGQALRPPDPNPPQGSPSRTLHNSPEKLVKTLPLTPRKTPPLTHRLIKHSSVYSLRGRPWGWWGQLQWCRAPWSALQMRRFKTHDCPQRDRFPFLNNETASVRLSGQPKIIGNKRPSWDSSPGCLPPKPQLLRGSKWKCPGQPPAPSESSSVLHTHPTRLFSYPNFRPPPGSRKMKKCRYYDTQRVRDVGRRANRAQVPAGSPER